MLPISKTLTFSTLVITAISLTFAAPIMVNQKAFAANLRGSGLGSPSTCSGISQYSGCYDCYPYYGSDGGFHHFHYGFGTHHFHGRFGLHRFGGSSSLVHRCTERHRNTGNEMTDYL